LNIEQLREIQKETDLKASETHKLDMSSREWFENRITAITGELYEALAVIEPFKDWKIQKGKVDGKRFLKSEEPHFEYRCVLTGNLYTKEQAIHETLVEECSDVLHFALTLINISELNNFEVKPKKHSVRTEWGNSTMVSGIHDDASRKCKNAIRKLFYYEDQVILSNSPTDITAKRLLREALHEIFTFYASAGVSIEELENAYYLKNQVNQTRMNNGY